MGEIRNKIITISGEPVSGKSTVVKALKEKYEQKGFKVQIISIGELFRESIKEEYIKMYPDRKDANLADIQADENFAEIRNKIDKIIDKEIVKKKGEEINNKERPNDIYIIDSRLAWQNIPDSFAVRLTIDENIAGQRVYNDKSRGLEDSYESVDDAKEKTKQRKLGEIQRYKQRYGVDLTNPENYNLVVDTSYSNTDELAEIIINGEELKRQKAFYPKFWASPVHFMPLQLGRTTGQSSFLGNTIESLAEDISKNGYRTTEDGLLEIIEKDGVKFLLEGNHRVFGALSAGKSLLPYYISHKDDRLVDDRIGIINYMSAYMEYLYDYVDGIEYYGGKLGGLKQLERLSIKDLLSFKKLESKSFKTADECR